jgi:hypothetical protein
MYILRYREMSRKGRRDEYRKARQSLIQKVDKYNKLE